MGWAAVGWVGVGGERGLGPLGPTLTAALSYLTDDIIGL